MFPTACTVTAYTGRSFCEPWNRTDTAQYAIAGSLMVVASNERCVLAVAVTGRRQCRRSMEQKPVGTKCWPTCSVTFVLFPFQG